MVSILCFVKHGFHIMLLDGGGMERDQMKRCSGSWFSIYYEGDVSSYLCFSYLHTIQQSHMLDNNIRKMLIGDLRSGGWVWIFGSCLFVPAGCGSLDNWLNIISAHELHRISVCNCDKIGSSNNLDLDAQTEGKVDSAVIGDIRGYILFFLCYFPPCEFGRLHVNIKLVLQA